MPHFKNIAVKQILTIFVLLFSLKTYSQKKDTIQLSELKLCELTIDKLKLDDPDLKKIKIEEMNLCSYDFIQDKRFENRIGYESKLYPGVIFQKYKSGYNTIAKIHLTKDFKGYLPDGNYIDLKTLKATDILKEYDSLNPWNSMACSDYWGINNKNKIYYYVKINKDKKPQYPFDEKYYSEQSIEGIDIVADCYSYHKTYATKVKPLIILEGKEVSQGELKNLKTKHLESFNIIGKENAVNKYGDRGKDGAIEISFKREN